MIPRERKSDVLKHPALKCLAPYHTINLTAGCPYECRYCYAQSFRSHPGQGKIIFYENTLTLLEKTLPRKRIKPRLVYFSTACEPFMPYPEIQEVLYGCMELLLNHGISLLISTKSSIPEAFLKLFARYSGKVHVQVGLTTINDNIRALLEPNATAINTRLNTLQRLIAFGIDCEARLDPLVPELTDSTKSFSSLLDAIYECGARRAVASFLFLRRANMGKLSVHYEDWSFREMVERRYTETIEGYCGGNSVRIPALEYRREKYAELQSLGYAKGVTVGLCACKNPDLTNACCHPQPAPVKRET